MESEDQFVMMHEIAIIRFFFLGVVALPWITLSVCLQVTPFENFRQDNHLVVDTVGYLEHKEEVHVSAQDPDKLLYTTTCTQN